MKRILENIIRLRNPLFRFDPAVTNDILLALLWDKGKAWLRGLRFLLRGRNPKGILLGREVIFFCFSKIAIGHMVKLDDHVFLSGMGKEGLSIGDHSGIGAYSRLVVSTSFNHIGSHIRIGNNVGIGEYAYLGGGGGLDIGDDCIIGQYLSCHPENHHYADLNMSIRHQGVSRKGIVIGKNCWIGSKVTILDGVTIGDHCVIAAGAVVTQSMPDYSVIGGVPARVLKSRFMEVKRKAV